MMRSTHCVDHLCDRCLCAAHRSKRYRLHWLLAVPVSDRHSMFLAAYRSPVSQPVRQALAASCSPPMGSQVYVMLSVL
jgi:hypothetical protein